MTDTEQDFYCTACARPKLLCGFLAMTLERRAIARFARAHNRSVPQAIHLAVLAAVYEWESREGHAVDDRDAITPPQVTGREP